MNSNDFWNRGSTGFSVFNPEQQQDANGDNEEMLTVVPVTDEPIEEDQCRNWLRQLFIAQILYTFDTMGINCLMKLQPPRAICNHPCCVATT